MDKCQYRTNQSTYSHNIHKSQHACPTCKCKSIELQTKNISMIYQPLFNHKNHQNKQPNLYLSNHFSEKIQHQQLSISPFYSNIFSQNKKNIYSPKKPNITFNYISPNKNKSHSNDSKFNTKAFKNSHFPQINNKFIDNQTIAITSKRQTKLSPYLEIFTKQNTPQKHKILKKNKNKSKQKLQITLAKKSSEKSLQKQKNTKEKSYKQNNEYELNQFKPKLNQNQMQYLLQSPKNTPINQLWTNQSRRSSKRQIQKIQQINYFNRINVPTSIQLISSDKNIKIFYKNPNHSILPQEHAIKQQQIKLQNHSSTQSLNILNNNNINIMNQLFTPFKNNLLHNDYDQQRKTIQYRQRTNVSLTQRQLALSISEELDLNYDYYYSRGVSDRQQSINNGL